MYEGCSRLLDPAAGDGSHLANPKPHLFLPRSLGSVESMAFSWSDWEGVALSYTDGSICTSGVARSTNIQVSHPLAFEREGIPMLLRVFLFACRGYRLGAHEVSSTPFVSPLSF